MSVVEAPLDASYWNETAVEGIERLIETVSCRELTNAFAAIEDAPVHDRYELRRALASIDAVKRLGAPAVPRRRKGDGHV